MPLPKETENDIRRELDDLISIGKSLEASTEHARAVESAYLRRSGIVDLRSDRVPPDRVEFGSWETRIKILARRILDESDYQGVLSNIQNAKETLNVASVQDILGILDGWKTAFESGSLDHVFGSTVTNTANEISNTIGNPLKQPVPNDPIARVHAYARDLAWGVKNKLWDNTFNNFGGKTLMPPSYGLEFVDFLNKWRDHAPDIDQLTDTGYLTIGRSTHHLTEKAFQLLEEKKSEKSLQVFIAYKHSESTGFASFLEEGLENSDLTIEVFTDKKIPLGDKWRERLAQAVRECDVFICLFGVKTLESEYVRDEIEWALDSNRRFIPILHNGYRGEGDYAELLSETQGPPVYEESAKAYEFTLIDLLRTLSNLSSQNNS